MKTAIVKFDNGDVITTSINGTDAEIKEYYGIGRTFNLGDGSGGDLMAKVVDVRIEYPGMENMTKEEGKQIIQEIMTEAENIKP